MKILFHFILTTKVVTPYQKEHFLAHDIIFIFWYGELEAFFIWLSGLQCTVIILLYHVDIAHSHVLVPCANSKQYRINVLNQQINLYLHQATKAHSS